MTCSPVGIAGIGAVCGAGDDIPSILDAFRVGRRNPIKTLPFESSIDCPTFQVSADLPILPDRYNNSRTLRLTMRAVREALADGGIDAFDPTARVGVCIGTTVACQLNSVPFYDAFRRGHEPLLDPVWNYLHANLAQAAAKLLNITGPRMTVVNACSSGTDAIGVAAGWIRAGLCEFAIAGGADELHPVPLAGFWSLGVMSGQPCAPFDRTRSGLNLGEGAGIVVLESEAHAAARGRRNRFEISGFGSACDGHHLTAPHPEGRGLETAIRSALAQAEITPGEIAFVNAHGTATPDNDRAEGKVLARLFGPEVTFLSTKGYTGHALGAAGGLEAVFTVLGLREGWIPPSAGFEQPADDVPVAPVSRQTTIDGKYALSTSLAFGGNNAALVVGVRDTFAESFFPSPVTPDFGELSRTGEGQGGGLEGRTDRGMIRHWKASPPPPHEEEIQAPAIAPAAILGIGAVTPLGRNLEEVARRLREPADPQPSVQRVNDPLPAEPTISKRMRRADRFSRMAAVTALDAWTQSRSVCQAIPQEKIGLIVTSGFGPHCRGFRFLDGLLDCGDIAASPTDFSHSVHGAAAAYITELLELRGPSLSTTDFEIGFEEAVLLAQCWLNDGTCQRVLVGAVEELGDVMLDCVSRMAVPDRPIVPGEGAVFFMLGPPTPSAIASIEATVDLRQANPPIGHDWSTRFGRSAASSAFNFLGALLSPEVEIARVVGASCELRQTSLLLTRHKPTF